MGRHLQCRRGGVILCAVVGVLAIGALSGCTVTGTALRKHFREEPVPDPCELAFDVFFDVDKGQPSYDAFRLYNNNNRRPSGWVKTRAWTNLYFRKVIAQAFPNSQFPKKEVVREGACRLDITLVGIEEPGLNDEMYLEGKRVRVEQGDNYTPYTLAYDRHRTIAVTYKAKLSPPKPTLASPLNIASIYDRSHTGETTMCHKEARKMAHAGGKEAVLFLFLLPIFALDAPRVPDSSDIPYALAMADAGDKIVRDLLSSKEVQMAAAAQAETKRRGHIRATSPSELSIQVVFDDSAGLVPNQALDAGEKAAFRVEVANGGEGAAFAVGLKVLVNDQEIQVDDPASLGDLDPASTRSVEVPLLASLNLRGGQARLDIKATETRGYDSKTVELVLPTRALVRPEVVFETVKVEDANRGLTEGNGNGVPENGETVELVCLVKNNGVGPAVATALALECDTGRFQVEKASEDLGEIGPGKTVRGVLRFAVARTDTGAPMAFTLRAKDGRGASEAEKSLAFQPGALRPLLAVTHQVRGTPTNGERFQVELVTTNSGALTAENVRLTASCADGRLSLRDADQALGRLAPGAQLEASAISIDIPRDYDGTTIALNVAVSQRDFPGAALPVNIEIRRREPRLVVDIKELPQVQQGQAMNLALAVRNEGSLEARDVRVTLRSSVSDTHLRWADDRASLELGSIPAGAESQPITRRLTVMRSFEPGKLPVTVALAQADFPGIEETVEINVLTEGREQVVIQADRPVESAQPTAAMAAAGTANQPPAIAFIHPRDDNHRSIRDSIRLHCRVWDDRGIADVNITVNGVQVGDKGIGAAGVVIEHTASTREYTPNITLSPGSNTVRVEAFDTDNLGAEKSITIHYQPPEQAVWVVAIGVDDYQHDGISNLRFAEADAHAFAQYMRDDFGVPADHVEELCGPMATVQNVKRTLGTRLRNQVGPQDTVIMYFSGHGAPEEDPNNLDGDSLEKYLLTYDADPADLFMTSLSMEEVARIFGRLKAERVVFIADTCYSGASGGKTLPSPRKAILSSEFLNRLVQGKGRVILTASGANELSLEYADLGGGHGVFTYFLLEGLKGAADRLGNSDGDVTVSEAYSYVSRKVPDFTKNAQHPVWKGEVEGGFILGRVAGQN